jgi:UDP-hydrolysing UDP-N-acetyl-D-glucosamine 2-epimerase
MPAKPKRLRICFVTGTRAEFGLMARTLQAIHSHPKLRLQIVATGMHLDRSRGYSLNEIRKSGFAVDAKVAWPASAQKSSAATAAATGKVMASLAETFRRLKTDVVLVVGDRVEAFAAAAAGQVAGLCVAHVHGGDRAIGIVDDSLRHAITKLAHIHFPATKASAERLVRLGEDRWRVRRVGSPGIDGIAMDAASSAEAWTAGSLYRSGSDRWPDVFSLVAYHPASADEKAEWRNAKTILDAVDDSFLGTHIVVVYPNNDPGARGIVRCWDGWPPSEGPIIFHRNLPRPIWLGLLRDAAVLIGNSSSGIIEAASFGTPVIDVGPRQAGREHGPNVMHVGYDGREIRAALQKIWNRWEPIRFPKRNPYGGAKTGERIAAFLAGMQVDERLLRKLIAY